MNYKIISSCSSGNATIIRDIILIDCGVTFKRLEKYYKKLKIVFLTHIHSDHFKKETIKRLAEERPTLRFACCEWLLNPLLECGVERKNIDVVKTILKQLGKPESLITYVTDRPGHDLRYAIDSTKVEKELGWDRTYNFDDGIKETIKWYVENQGWIEDIKSGAYKNSYKK